jgi:hypothetical protein
MINKERKNCSKDDIFRILDSIEALQEGLKEQNTIYVPKRAYKVAKKMLKIEGKAGIVKIKTY